MRRRVAEMAVVSGVMMLGVGSLACSGFGSTACDVDKLGAVYELTSLADVAVQRSMAIQGVAEACADASLAHGELAAADVRPRLLGDYIDEHPDAWSRLCGDAIDITRLNPFVDCDVTPLGWSQDRFESMVGAGAGPISQPDAAREMFAAFAALRVLDSDFEHAAGLAVRMGPLAVPEVPEPPPVVQSPTRDSRAFVGQVGIMGGLTADSIRASVERGEVLGCLDALGTITIRAVITGAGTVASTQVEASTFDDERSVCATDALATVSFDEPPGGGIVVVTIELIGQPPL